MEYTHRKHVNHIKQFDTNIILYHYSEKRKEIIPNNIIHLKFGDTYNGPVNNLHSNFLSIYFTFCFNSSIDNLPNSINTITIDGRFNHPINKLPTSLLYFTLKNINYKYNIPIASSIYIIKYKEQILNLMENLPNEINFITPENYNKNYKFENVNTTNIKKINILKCKSNVVNPDYQHLINYID